MEKQFILRPGKFRETAARAYEYILDQGEQHPLEVAIRPWKKRRNVEQNKLYWSVLTAISEQVTDEDGKKYSPETWHGFCKAKFIGKDTVLVDGEAIQVEKSSTTLNVMEFSDYVTQIQAWAVDHGVRFYHEAG